MQVVCVAYTTNACCLPLKNLFMSVFTLFDVIKRLRRHVPHKIKKSTDKKSTAKRKWKETVGHDCVSLV